MCKRTYNVAGWIGGGVKVTSKGLTNGVECDGGCGSGSVSRSCSKN